MANCSYCDSFILFGGKTDQTGRYCNANCQQAGNLLALSHRIPKDEMDRLVREFHEGNCPQCGRRGPVDMHKAHKVWSALVLTSWSSSPAPSCKSCATKRQLGSILFCGVLGWWGFPWGLVMTPVQIIRNIAEMAGGPQRGRPSALLEKFVRLNVAASVVQQSQAQRNATAAQPPPMPAPQSDNDERYMPKNRAA
jgi:hypothetical protein